MNPLIIAAILVEFPGLLLGFCLGVVFAYIFAVVESWGWLR